MSSIHYKFKAALEYKTLVFDGLHISVNDLKKEICEKEHIKTESFDLVLYNAYTNQPYREVIPRNSSVIVQRTPRDNAAKLPKVHDTSNSGIVNKANPTEPAFVPHIDSEKFDKMTEEERLTHVKEVSTYKYLPSNFQKKTSSILSGPPPPTYICNRCSQPGHWYKNCPMLNTKRTTGLTMDELTDTTPDDPLAMLHPSGRFVVPIMHMKARQQKRVEAPATSEPDNREIPADLKCPLCSQLLREAVLATCCGDSFCAECVQQRLLESSNAKCPGTNCFQSSISADKLIPNIKLRRMVENYKNTTATTHSSATSANNASPAHELTSSNKPILEEIVPTQPVQRVRIGLSNRTTGSSSAVITSLHQPTTQVQQQAIQQQSVSSATPVTTSQTIAAFSAASIDTTPSLPVASTSSTPQQLPSLAISTPPQQALETNVSQPIIPAQVNTSIMPPVSTVLPVNIHQPPPGYAPMLHTTTTALTDPNLAPPGTCGASAGTLMQHLSASSVLMPLGLQPPPPGLSAPTMYSTVAAPRAVKDAWDEFLERKEKNRQRAIVMPRTRHSSRSSSYFSSATSSSESSNSRSRSRTRSHSRSRTRSRSWSRDRSNRDRRRSSRERRSYRRRGSSRSPRTSYSSSRYHRNPNPNFMYFQHPSMTVNAQPSSNHQQHRSLPTNSNYPSALNVPNSSSYSSYTGNPDYRSSRNYDERSHRRSPRSSVYDYRSSKRKSSSRDREFEKKERHDNPKKRSNDSKKQHGDDSEKKRMERKHSKSRHKEEKDDTKHKENISIKKSSTRTDVKPDHTDLEEFDNVKSKEETCLLEEIKNAGVVERSGDELSPIKHESEEEDIALNTRKEEQETEEELSGIVVVENVQTEEVKLERNDEDEINVMDDMRHEENESASNSLKVIEEKVNQKQDQQTPLLDETGVTENIVAELPKEVNTDATETMDVDKSKSEKKKKRKKKKKHRRDSKEDTRSEKRKRHRHSSELTEQEKQKKSKKHKRTKEEKEKRKEEKEKRREEKRKRKQSNLSTMEEEKRLPEVSQVEEIVKDINSKNKTDESRSRISDHASKEEAKDIVPDLPARYSKLSEESGKSNRILLHESRDGSKSKKKHKHDERRSRSNERNREEKRREKRSRHDDFRDEEEDRKERKTNVTFLDTKTDDSKRPLFSRDEKLKDDEKFSLLEKSSKNEKRSHKSESSHTTYKESKKREETRELKTDKVKSGESRSRTPKSRAEKEDKKSEKRKSEISRDDHKKARQRSNRMDSTEADLLGQRVSEQQPNEKSSNDAESDKKSLRPVEVAKLSAGSKGDGPCGLMEEKSEKKFGDEKNIKEGLELTPEIMQSAEAQKDKPNLTVEVKLGGEKKVTRENVFENAGPKFNARQKIKMILLSESQRYAADRSKRRGSKLNS